MLLGKRHLHYLKLVLLSPQVEFVLLLSYTVIFCVLVAQASVAQSSVMDNYALRQSLVKYFDLETANSLSNMTAILDYTSYLLQDKLWIYDGVSPFFPVGEVHLVQYRVRSCCDHLRISANHRNETWQAECEAVIIGDENPVHSPYCNELYSAGGSEALQYNSTFNNNN